ncbi:MAG: hypothetical protein ACE5KE_13890 [Methanosarcinales archaeon]
MGIYQDYKIKIGGAKPRCFGTVEFTPIKLKYWINPFDKKELSGNELNKRLSEELNKKDLIEEELLQQFKEEVAIARNELCPRGNY